jgi:hypothetical protein
MPNPLGGWAAGGTRLSLEDYRADFRATESMITEQDSWKLELARSGDICDGGDQAPVSVGIEVGRGRENLGDPLSLVEAYALDLVRVAVFS